MQICCGIHQPLLAGVLRAQIQLVADRGLVLIGAAVVEVIEYRRHTRARVTGNDHDVRRVRSGQRIGLVLRGIGAGLIHGVRVDFIVLDPAGTFLEVRAHVNSRNVHLDCRRRLDDGGRLRYYFCGLRCGCVWFLIELERGDNADQHHRHNGYEVEATAVAGLAMARCDLVGPSSWAVGLLLGDGPRAAV